MTAIITPGQQLAREQKRAVREGLELAMLQQIRAEKLDSGMVREHVFHETRAWRFDFAWPQRKWALEVEGGTWTGGGHSTGAGFAKDCEKYAAGVLSGWRVLRATTNQVRDGTALGWLILALRPRPSILSTLGQAEGGELAHPKEHAVRSPTYLRRVAALPCCNCGIDGRSQAAHLNFGKGLSIKAADNKTFPLCADMPGLRGCHSKYDAYELADKHESAEMGATWARETYTTLKRAGLVPLGVPAPRFEA